MALVVQTLSALRTPRIAMQVCAASNTTPTPRASSSCITRSASSSVIRSCTCGRRDRISTMRASLLSPTMCPFGKIRDVGLAEERQQMVLAHALEADVLDEHHFVIFFGKRFPQDDGRIFAQPGEHLLIHACNALGRFTQTFAIGIFADGQENLAHRRRNAFEIDRRVTCAAAYSPWESSYAVQRSYFALGEFRRGAVSFYEISAKPPCAQTANRSDEIAPVHAAAEHFVEDRAKEQRTADDGRFQRAGDFPHAGEVRQQAP